MKLSKKRNDIYFFKDNHVWIIPTKTLYYLILLPCLATASMTQAALTAMTVKTIQGTAPYLTFDNGTTKATNMSDLLWLQLSNGEKYTPQNNTSATTIIELPVAGQTFADITTLVPTTSNTIALTDLIGAPNNYLGDEDEDSEITVSGNLNLSINDMYGNTVTRTESLNPCYAPFKITLSTSESTLKTKYGDPSSNSFDVYSEIYYIKPKANTPYSCWAQPNLSNTGNRYYNPNYTGWHPEKGFKLQGSEPTDNFPTIGSHGLYFNLTIDGISGSKVSYSKYPASSGLDLSLSESVSSDTVKVMLTGPRGNVGSPAPSTANPTTFTLYSDTEKTKIIYNFTISKWLIVQPNGNGGKTYCDGLSPSGITYKLPKVRDYTNANGSGWTDGPSGQRNNYSRRIGGGVFAEWGSTTNEYYTDSDWNGERYRTRETCRAGGSDVSSCRIYPENGYIGYGAPSRTVCVNN